MSSKKRRAPARRRAPAKDPIRRAIAAGEDAAAEAIEARAEGQRSRRTHLAALQARPRRRRAPALAAAPIPKKTLTLLGPKPTAGVLLAEGDSWFDYPGRDVLGLLEDEYLFDVESVAHKGDCVEDMAHSPKQFEGFARKLEKLLRDGKVPRAILLSGGGNDIAGAEFAILLNHAASGLPPMNEDVVHGVIDVRLRTAYASIIGGITRIATHYLGRTIPMVTHGYDYAIPDGRGFLGGFSFLPGPWLEPGFRRKGHGDLSANKDVIVALIDRFNRMLIDVGSHPQFAHVHYLDLRRTLKHGSDYEDDWANELHPSKKGFGRVTKKFADLIATL